MLVFLLGMPPDLFFNPAKTLSWVLIRVYQFFLSDIQPDVCNFRDDISCSKFGRRAVEKYGIWGVLMAFDRLQRCNPDSRRFIGLVYGVDKGKLVDTLRLFSPEVKEVPRMLLR